mmetsp:Transcript_108545/g.191917  ORF Transcript_108545/g.191917 Transcript_108545/m.191917 type:complete len:217 (-) Transcript_108545:70-720(-)
MNGVGALPKYKVVVLGEMTVGKTSLINRYLHNVFQEKVDATIGMDFQSKNVSTGDCTVRLQLWDTAGQERFRSLVTSYIRDAAAAVVVYDVTQRHTYENAFKWMEEVASARGSNGTVVFLVGNKIDLVEAGRRAVELGEAKHRAEEAGASFMETSAKSGENVTALFQLLADLLPAADRADANVAPAGGTSGQAPLRPSFALSANQVQHSPKRPCGC